MPLLNSQHRVPLRRALATFCGCLLAAATALGGLANVSSASDSPPPADRRGGGSWVTTWGTGLTAVPDREAEYPDGRISLLNDQTLRQVVHTSVGGRALTLRLSNQFGDKALQVGEVHVALRERGAGTAIRPGTDRVVTFGGLEAVTIPAGTRYRSDRVDLDVPPDSDLVVSIYLPEPTRVTTVHQYAMQVNAVASGNVTGARRVTPVAETHQWLFLSDVSVLARPHSAAVVALGASLTDGVGTSEGTNRRWPDRLSDQLRSDRHTRELGVVNMGIGGNRLLHDPNAPVGQPVEAYAAYFGLSGLRRFETDVLGQPGVEHMIVALGVNDLALPSSGSAVPEETVTVEQVISGHRQLIARAHAHGLKIYGGTVAPFKGARFGFWTEAIEAKRQAINRWIRTSGAYDAVIDFDAAVRDPVDPLRLTPAYDSGDHIHVNDAGASAMAGAVPMRLLR